MSSEDLNLKQHRISWGEKNIHKHKTINNILHVFKNKKMKLKMKNKNSKLY